jgi:ATP-dependent exoDNAse (exonuclease V) beta subunit
MLRSANNIAEVKRRIQAKYKADLGAASTNKWNKANVQNRYDGLLTIVNNCTSIKGIENFIKELDMHQDGASTRKLMTIHASKGLETETVYFLQSHMCDYFKDRADTQWEREQEDNLYYVACTRALKNLAFID